MSQVLRAAILLLAVALPAAPAAAETHTVVLNGIGYDLEVAADPARRAVGMAGRRSIPERGGMLFVFAQDRPLAFWMRDCLVDMSLIFLDRSGRILATHEMKVEPPRTPYETQAQYLGRLRRYPSGLPARYAIELRAGEVGRLGLRVGQQLDLGGVPIATR